MTDLITGSPNTFSQGSPTALRPSTGPSGWSSNKIIQIILILLVLALLGLNVFAYLAKGTDYITHILEFITGNVAEKAGGVLATSGKGVELGADVVGGAIQDAGAVIWFFLLGCFLLRYRIFKIEIMIGILMFAIILDLIFALSYIGSIRLVELLPHGLLSK